jgi:hypothetical protein
MRILGIVMLILQLLGTVVLFPIIALGGPVIWFFWWVAFIVWIVCILAGRKREVIVIQQPQR